MNWLKEDMKKFIIEALKNHRCDNLTRAKLAFANYTPKQMNEEYGESGNTPNQIIAGYQEHSDKCDSSIEFIKGL